MLNTNYVASIGSSLVVEDSQISELNPDSSKLPPGQNRLTHFVDISIWLLDTPIAQLQNSGSAADVQPRA